MDLVLRTGTASQVWGHTFSLLRVDATGVQLLVNNKRRDFSLTRTVRLGQKKFKIRRVGAEVRLTPPKG